MLATECSMPQHRCEIDKVEGLFVECHANCYKRIANQCHTPEQCLGVGLECRNGVCQALGYSGIISRSTKQPGFTRLRAGVACCNDANTVVEHCIQCHDRHYRHRALWHRVSMYRGSLVEVVVTSCINRGALVKTTSAATRICHTHT